MQPPLLTAPFRIGDVELANRVVLAPLAGIGNWFVRLQARRHGAGLTVSEMVSSFGLHYRNERTLQELLRLHPDEHPVSVQLFGQDPEVMRSAAAIVAEAGADLIDINMGCPVRKVCKTGAGAALLSDRGLAVRLAAAAREGGGIPVTVKLRSGLVPGGREGFDLALRLVEDAGVSAIGFHPRSAATQHKGRPDYPLARELAARLEGPMIISGGLDSAEDALHAYRASGADAVMIARGSLGNPWIFEQLTGRRSVDPDRDEGRGYAGRAQRKSQGKGFPMIKKRSAQLAALACAGLASCWLLSMPASAAAKTKEVQFTQCLSTAVNIPDGPPPPFTTVNPAASFAVPVRVPKFKGRRQDGVVTRFNSVGVRISHT